MEIRSATYLISSPDHRQAPAADQPEYAFIGRSNVGKSSLINMITGRTRLAKTSATPGKTRLINYFNIESAKAPGKTEAWRLVDLPGYGFAKVSIAERKRWENMIEGYLRKRETLVHVFLLIDSRHQPQQADLDFAARLDRWKVPFTLVFTKSDKENQRTVQANVKAFLNGLLESRQFLPGHIVSSAVKKTGRDHLLRLIGEMNEEWRKPA
jgi:GTP-binding protein